MKFVLHAKHVLAPIIEGVTVAVEIIVGCEGHVVVSLLPRGLPKKESACSAVGEWIASTQVKAINVLGCTVSNKELV